MIRRSSLRKRLERLEGAQHQLRTAGGFALVVLEAFTGEVHIERFNGNLWQMPGPGPGIEAFGDFEQVVYMTAEEMEIQEADRPRVITSEVNEDPLRLP
jgi:hypothetical protein